MIRFRVTLPKGPIPTSHFLSVTDTIHKILITHLIFPTKSWCPNVLAFTSLHLHPHPNPPLTSAISQYPRHAHFPTIALSVTNLTVTNVHPSLSLSRRCFVSKFNIFTTMASIQSTSSLEFDEFDPDPRLTNEDLKPTTSAQRTFSWWEMASLWVGLVVGVPSYYLAGSLVDLGMAWWQGIATVVAANLILLIPLILTGDPGTRYGISFPVLARSSFGIHGAHIPTLLRALVGCGWYGIETWIGGEAIFLLLPNSIKQSTFSKFLPWLGTSPLEFACFIVFWVAQLTIVWKGIDGIRELEKYSAPILIVLTSCLLAWSYVKAGGFSHMLSISSSLSNSEFWSLFFPSLTANISFWATLALNIPDFTRYAKSQSDQIIGQAGLPVFMGAFTFVGLAVTSSTKVIFGQIISNPIQLLGQIGGFSTTILAIIGISLATITTNIAANVVAPANALVNLSPSKFTFRRGALLTALLGIAFQPWRLLRSSESFVYTWLVGYSAIMGPIAGILLADYYLIQRKVLSIKDLYSLSPYGVYYYSRGFNLAAIVALVIGILPVIPGFLQKVGLATSVSDIFGAIYNNAWFFSFFSAGFFYWFLSSLIGNKDKSLPSDPLLPVPK
ncbi:purine-uracil permease NCS1-like [Quillaja saponaria]|uniref:Purine-uracil permease NCS1-like n=1 Tax=Quillaja saponaria TaxID=32244 RepID=A0AAD7Q8K7_QUISA|nr:purine-uracil permease NCS1-like [Quillaja saponaria]